MYPEKTLTSASKFLSLVLRHNPELIGVALDRWFIRAVVVTNHKMLVRNN